MTKTDAVQTEGANAKPVKAKKEKKPKDAKAVEVVVEEALVLKKDKKSKKRKDAGQDTPAAVEENGHTHGSAVKVSKMAKKQKLSSSEGTEPAVATPAAEAEPANIPEKQTKKKSKGKDRLAAGAEPATAPAVAAAAAEPVSDAKKARKAKNKQKEAGPAGEDAVTVPTPAEAPAVTSVAAAAEADQGAKGSKNQKKKAKEASAAPEAAAVEQDVAGDIAAPAVQQPVKEKEKKSKKRKLPAEAQPPAAEQPEAEADAVAEPPAAKKVKKVKKTASAAGADTADAAATAEDAKEAATSNGNGSDALKSSGKDASNGEGAATGSRAFQRVKAEEWLGAKGSWDNSYRAQYGEDGYGLKAQEILGQVRGRDFRHEKTKKKRGSYRGGLIDDNIRSFKFESDGE